MVHCELSNKIRKYIFQRASSVARSQKLCYCSFQMSHLLWPMFHFIFFFLPNRSYISSPINLTYSFRLSTNHFHTIFFLLYLDYTARHISCFTPLLAACLILCPTSVLCLVYLPRRFEINTCFSED